MSLFVLSGKMPEIFVPHDDFDVLMKLASAGAGDDGPADDLLSELERATVTEDTSIPANVVRMGSTVSYSLDGAQPKTVKLVYPADADISSGAISVLTPIGAALLGLKPGQTIGFEARDGSEREIRVIAVFAGNGSAKPEATAHAAVVEPFDDPGPSAA
ncbi:nucleoside diphosphate kinase regulator [Pelagibacterium sediminicola]|uniref:nucleoside diphosphate kinase regulator n=1 Tax=Pelagibacterium sediminicola TaxID=2248761 RepID=UPI000E320AA6|nr:nucleoside diphosphate kinase regulator [Pelagibacterium sediminicola]